jgi:hypothetical protein
MKNKHPGRVVEADAFVLKDESGMQRAVLSMDKEEPSLRLYDAHGRARVDLRLEKDEPSLHLDAGPGTSRLGLRLAEGELLFVFSGPKLGAETALHFAEDGLELRFIDLDLRLDASIKVNLDSTGLAVHDTEGRLLCSIPGRKV